MNKGLKVALLAIVVVLVCVGGFFGWFFSHLPKRGPDRVAVSDTIVGVWDGAAYAWIVRTPHGAALIDAGLDPGARAILAELGRAGLDAGSVHTILLTHGHADHYGGALAFPRARVWIGAEDDALARGTRPPRAFGPKVFGMMGSRKAPERMEPLVDGKPVDADGTQVRVVAVPGHTPGSMMFLVDDVLFTGDSVFGAQDGVAPCPDLFSEDPAENLRSLDKLKAVPFVRMADGHTGLVTDAKPKLAALLAR